MAEIVELHERLVANLRLAGAEVVTMDPQPSVPDLVCLAKGLAAGFVPVGATLVRHSDPDGEVAGQVEGAVKNAIEQWLLQNPSSADAIMSRVGPSRSATRTVAATCHMA